MAKKSADTSSGTTVAIVGGGFGGAYLLRELGRLSLPGLKVLLFEPREAFVFTPLLHEVATAGLERTHVEIPYSRILPGCAVHICERVTGVSLSEKTVATAHGRHRYDYLVLATGSETNFFAQDSLAKETLQLKDVDDALAIRARLEEVIAREPRVGRTPRIVVVGGGPTGVELVAEIAQLLRLRLRDRPFEVELIQGAKTILPAASARLQGAAATALTRLGVKVRASTRVIGVKKGELLSVGPEGRGEMAADAIIWVAGVRPSTVPLSGSRIERYPVLPSLRLVGHDDVFAIGDAAGFDPALKLAPVPALAQAAVKQAELVSQNIVRSIRGARLAEFSFRQQGFLVSLGQRQGAGEIETPLGTLFLKGFPAWWLWRTVFLFKFLGLKHKALSAGAWTVRLFRCRRKKGFSTSSASHRASTSPPRGRRAAGTRSSR